MRTRRIIDTVRRWSLAHLSRENHHRLARIFGFVVARVKERGIRKPLDQMVNCGLPLIYISQPRRSGGTLILNLFDGHRSCFVFPHELSWEKNGFHWDDSLRAVKSPRKAYGMLYDRWIDNAIARGIKGNYPFHFNRSLQKRIFYHVRDLGFDESRHWLDRYFTSFFNAWVDYQNLYGSSKKFCVAFCPWPLQTANEVMKFYDYYPDGFRIQVIRNPLGWWASEKGFQSKQKDLDRYLERRWIKPVRIGLEVRGQNPERYLLVSFDDLIREPEDSLRKLCAALRLPFDSNLLNPTYNGMFTVSNTSLGKGEIGIDKSVLYRWKRYLSGQEVDEIRRRAMPLYQDTLSRCINT